MKNTRTHTFKHKAILKYYCQSRAYKLEIKSLSYNYSHTCCMLSNMTIVPSIMLEQTIQTHCYTMASTIA